jgi:hypothetical protein
MLPQLSQTSATIRQTYKEYKEKMQQIMSMKPDVIDAARLPIVWYAGISVKEE